YGNRVGIWTVGCPHRCFNCCNPELQPVDESKEITLDHLFHSISSITETIDGITISGGDPFFQPEELAILIAWLVEKGHEDILIYSGYKIEELLSWNRTDVQFILENIAVLIDGLYIDKLNDNLSLRGSSNQRVIVLKEKF